MGCKKDPSASRWKPRSKPKQKAVEKASKPPKRGTLNAKSPRNSRRDKDATMDALARQCREQADGYCPWCKRSGMQMEADHIKTRGAYPELMDEPLNYMALCVDCHRLKDTHRGEWNRWIEDEFGGLIHRLEVLSQGRQKVYRT